MNKSNAPQLTRKIVAVWSLVVLGSAEVVSAVQGTPMLPPPADSITQQLPQPGQILEPGLANGASAPRGGVPDGGGPPLGGNPSVDERMGYLPPAPVRDKSVRLEDVASVVGEHLNTLEAYSLVMGLSTTGAKDINTQTAIINILRKNGLQTSLAEPKNCCLVLVQARVGSYSKKGQVVDVSVSAVGDSISVENGTLIRTELLGYDGEVYVVASGSVVSSGFAAAGQGASVRSNSPNHGICKGVIEKEVCCDQQDQRFVHFALRDHDPVTASRVTAAINELFPNHARTLNSGSIEVQVPLAFRQARTEFIAALNALRVEKHLPARVIVNSRTGTIVIGGDVRISHVTFANQNLVISTTESPVASQPAPFSEGTTQVLPRTQIQAFSEVGRYNVLNEGVSVSELANALNQMGIPPKDLISIFQDIKNLGALQAELIIQ